MESVYLLIPVSVILVFGIALAFWWSVRSGQFDDLEGPGFRVLMDDDLPQPQIETKEIAENDKLDKV
jgi:cbb3-type cytochrome oxidase maturation protein